MRRRAVLIVGIGAVGLAAIGGLTARAFHRDIDRARARVATGSRIMAGPAGDIEYAVAGDGPPVMVLHGTGGGFDQGLSMAAPLIAAGFRVVAPSRFGYLRSSFPEDASSEAQADALIGLMDHLGIARMPVIGGSAGALPALHLAIRHPDRCRAVVALVPATFVPGRPAPRPGALAAAIMRFGLRSDFLFWAGCRVAEDAMIGTLLATDPALVAAAAPDEQARVRAILRDILPVSLRVRGLLNDAALAGNPAPMALQTIHVPTLAISLEDDRFGTCAAARHIAATVPGARMVGYPTGGHVFVGRQEAVFDAIAGFLRSLPET